MYDDDNDDDHDHDHDDNGNDDKAAGKEDKINYSDTWIHLPLELLVKILSYLSLHDRIMMLYVCKRFLELSKVPLLWKKLVGPYGRRHVHGVFCILKACGKHVRQIFFPAHLTSTQILEMVHYCTEVTHLYLPEGTILTSEVEHLPVPERKMIFLDPPKHTKIILEKIICTLTHLQELNMFLKFKRDSKFIEQLMIIISYSSIKLTLHFLSTLERPFFFSCTVARLKNFPFQDHSLPLIISTSFSNECGYRKRDEHSLLLELTSRSSSFEIAFYNNKKYPMNFYSPVPFKVYKCGTPPLIRLSDLGIMGLKHDIFHLSKYNDHHGSNHHILVSDNTSEYKIKGSYFNSNMHLNSVSCIDLTSANVQSDHLKQFAVACPNLQRLNLKDNVDCLNDLQGLHAIVHTCQNLESLNLSGISISRVQSYLLLWELLSSLKKLTFLTIDLCMLRLYDVGDDEQKLVNMCESFYKLQALDIHCESTYYGNQYCDACQMDCNKKYLLFSYFPSLTYCAMWEFKYSALAYAITNCHHLKYLFEYDPYNSSESLSCSINCQLRELKICNSRLEITNDSAEALSVHGKLECVTLRYISSITHKGIAILINNSPNLIFLEVIDEYAKSCGGWGTDEEGCLVYKDPKLEREKEIRTVKSMLNQSYHILFDVGTFAYGELPYM